MFVTVRLVHQRSCETAMDMHAMDDDRNTVVLAIDHSGYAKDTVECKLLCVPLIISKIEGIHSGLVELLFRVSCSLDNFLIDAI